MIRSVRQAAARRAPQKLGQSAATSPSARMSVSITEDHAHTRSHAHMRIHVNVPFLFHLIDLWGL